MDRNYLSLFQDIKNMSLQYRETLGLPKLVTFGLEPEIEGVTYDQVHRLLDVLPIHGSWEVCFDASTTSHDLFGENIVTGAELNSPILKDSIANWKDLQLICSSLRNMGAYCGNKVGGHIHVGAPILNSNVKYLKRLLQLWVIYEDIIYDMGCGFGRNMRMGIDQYARKIRIDLLENWDAICQCSTYCDLIILLQTIFIDKYVGFNFQHISSFDTKQIERNTWEFRFPNGSLQEIIWQNNVNFIVRLMLYVKSKNFNTALIDQKFNTILESFHLIQTDDTQDILSQKLQPYLEDSTDLAIELSELIFDNVLDQYYFLKQCLSIYIDYDVEKLIKKKRSHVMGVRKY